MYTCSAYTYASFASPHTLTRLALNRSPGLAIVCDIDSTVGPASCNHTHVPIWIGKSPTIAVSKLTSALKENSHSWLWLGTHSRVSVVCLLYTSPSPRDATLSRMPSSA